MGKTGKRAPNISTVLVYDKDCSNLHIIDKVASIINNIGLFTKENEIGPNYILVHWGNSTKSSFTVGTSKRAYWPKITIIENIYWSEIVCLSQVHTADFYRCDKRFLSLV